MRFKTVGDVVELKMWEKTMLPESEMVEVNGKKAFKKTGKEVEMTTYTFRDSFGDVLVMLSDINTFRALEGEKVNIETEIVFNTFKNQNRVKLANVTLTEKA